MLKLQDEGGAIVNCLPEEVGKGSDLQTTPELCDMVYTQGFALMALTEAAGRLKKTDFGGRQRNWRIFWCRFSAPMKSRF